MQDNTQKEEHFFLVDSPELTTVEKWEALGKNKQYESLAKAVLQLIPLGVTLIRVTFYGSGDSGDFDYPEYLPYVGERVIPPTVSTDISNFVENLVNAKITTDWYNNEGGGGSVSIDVESMEIDASSYYNITEQHDGDGFGMFLEKEIDDLNIIPD